MSEVTFKGNTTKIKGSFLFPKDLLPNFELITADLTPLTLDSFAHNRKLFLFVPSIDTMICKKEIKKIEELSLSYLELGIVLLLVSCDLPFAQKRFCEEENIQNIQTLSTMRSKAILEQYGVLIASGPLEGLSARAVVLANNHDVVIYSELVSEITDEPDYTKLFHAIEELK